MSNAKRFLIETCLLTHGLLSVTNEDMAALWPRELDNIVWMEEGRIIVGGIDEFLPFRQRAAAFPRIDMYQVEQAEKERISGALTASGTMEICSRRGLPLAVSCGIGGIGDIPGEELCPDLPALQQLPVALLATSPKDMLDIPATFCWLRERGVRVLGIDTAICSGYIFQGEAIPLKGMVDHTPISPGQLLLKPIPCQDRVADKNILAEAIQAGLAAQKKGEYYHPAVNAYIDRCTDGHSSRIQFLSLIDNALTAQKLLA